MDEEQRPLVLYAVTAVTLGILGLLGAALWYFRNRHAPVGAGLGNLGPAILGLAAIVMVLWGVVVIVGFRAKAKEEE